MYPAELSAQQNVIDSLKLMLEEERPRDSIAKIYTDIAGYSMAISLEESKLYAEKAIALSQEEGLPDIEALAYSILANYYSGTGEIDKAKALFFKALNLAQPNAHRVQMGVPNGLGNIYFEQNQIDSALHYYRLMLEASKVAQAELPGAARYEVTALMNMGGCFSQMGKHSESVKYKEDALSKAKSIDYQAMIPLILENLAHNEIDKEKKINYYLEAVELNKKNNATKHLISVYYRLGYMYDSEEEVDQQLEYWEMAFQLLQENTYTTFSNVNLLGEYAMLLGELGRLEEAKEKGDACLKIAQQLGDATSLGYANSCLAVLALRSGERDKSFALAKKSAEQVSESQGNQVKYTAWNNASHVFIQTKRPENALNYLRQTEAGARQSGYNRELLAALEMSYEAYKGIADFENALVYHEKYNHLKDSIQREDNLSAMQDIRTKYETEKTEAENELLRRNNELVVQQRNGFTAAAALLLLLLLAMGWLFTRVRKARKEIALQNAQLTQLNHTKDRLFAIISHDLRGEASAFQNLTQIVNFHLKKGNTERLEKLFTQVEKSAANLNALLDNLLQWALTQLSGFRLSPKLVELNKEAEEVLRLFEEHARVKGIALKKELPESLAVKADENSVQLILRNLLSNAIKFTPEGGHVVIKGAEEEGYITVIVSDTGRGMAPDKLASVFEINRRESEKGTAGERGTGLGLALCKEFVERNGGSIAIESVPGEGTVCRLSLPKAV